MFNFDIWEIGVIGVVALVAIGPERLPRVARVVGHFVGKAQRYVADVKAEVNRSIELEELQKMKAQMEDAARGVQQSVQGQVDDLNQATTWNPGAHEPERTDWHDGPTLPAVAPTYEPPRKNWRVKRGAVPQWYKQRAGVRRHVQSAAARVARFRPPGARR